MLLPSSARLTRPSLARVFFPSRVASPYTTASIHNLVLRRPTTTTTTTTPTDDFARSTDTAKLRPLSHLGTRSTTTARRFSSLAAMSAPAPAPTSSHVPSDASSDGKDDPFRLPKHVRPVHYDLTVKTDLENLKYDGFVEIDIDILQPTSTIVLNAASPLRVTAARVSSTALKTDQTMNVEVVSDKQRERVSLSLPPGTLLHAGSKAKVWASYEAELTKDIMGYYRSTWEHENKKGWMAITQFEPTAARRAFPCWDEPELKATFDITMIHKKDTVALSNTPAVSSAPLSTAQGQSLLKTEGKTEGKTEEKGTADDSDWVVTKYERTPKMSTYLVAYANGPFKHLESSFTSPLTGKQVPIRFYATPEYIHQGHFALEVTAKIMPVLEKIFDIPYPLAKLDTLVASDFDAGAMENWGLITGRASIYLYDPEKSGLAAKKATAGVQSHECSHMWFGNIVTMNWWEQLWLNESFATLMGEVIVLDRIFPEWKSSSEFIVHHLDRALDLDSKRSSHPIEVPLEGENVEDAINQVFDAISYSKGASVLRMLSNQLGQETFLKGVSIYLKKHLYGNAVSTDLWNGISEASGLDVAKIMKNWTLKVGFPVVTVTEEEDGLRIRQNRFLSTGDLRPEENTTLWYVPLELKTVGPNGPVVQHDAVLDEEREKFLPLPNAKQATFKLNAETTGVYRVAYTPERLSKLGEEAAKPDSAFTVDDRLGLVSDAVTLAQSGYSKTSGALNLIDKLKGDDAYLVKSAISGHMASLVSVWWEQPDEVRSSINAFRRDIFGPLAEKLGFDVGKDDDAELRQLRSATIAAAAAAGHEPTLREIQRRFKLFMEGDQSAVPGDLLRTIFVESAKHGGEKEYVFLLSVIGKPATQQQKVLAMLALGWTQDEALIERTLKYTFSDEVKEQDLMYFFASLAANPLSRRKIWQLTKDHYEDLSKRVTNNSSLGRLVRYSFSSFTSDEDLKDVETFFKDKDTRKIKQGLEEGIDAVKTNKAWLQRDAEDVEQWLRAHHYLK